jgi:hypothetical protein
MTVDGCAVRPLLEVAVTDVVNGPIVGTVAASGEVWLVGGFFSEIRDAGGATVAAGFAGDTAVSSTALVTSATARW